MKYQCVRCGKIKETKQEMLTCSGACRVAYHRYLKAGNPPIAAIKIDDVTPETSVLQTPPSHEQASFSNEQIELLRQLVTDMATIKAVMFAIAGGQSFGDQKKSDMLTQMMEDRLKSIDPPVAVVAVETEEDIEKRRKISVQNTMAAIEDF